MSGNELTTDRSGKTLKDYRELYWEERKRNKELRAENGRLKLKHFIPVNEDAQPDTDQFRKNFQRMNGNFEMCDIDLLQVNVGDEPNDCTGDTVYDAFVKINVNFATIEKRFSESPKS